MPPILFGVGTATSPPADPGVTYAAASRPGSAATTGSTNVHTTEVSRIRHTALSAIVGPVPTYGNFGYGEIDNDNAITIQAAIEYPANTFTPLTFNGGSSSVSILPGQIAEADQHGLVIPLGQNFWVRTGTTVGAGEKYYMPRSTDDALGEGVVRDSGMALVTSGTITPIYAQNANAPLGVSSSSPYRPTVALIGDSITYGLNVGFDTAFGCLACKAVGYGYFQLGQNTERASSYATALGRHNRIKLSAKASNAVVLYGTNDLIASRTGAQIMADLVVGWLATKAAGLTQRVFGCTIPPRTTSTDGWATTANQTVVAGDSNRVAVNDWLRGGAPIDPGTLAPVAVGTGGALVAGDLTHPLKAVFDTADSVESARNSGKWKPGPTGGDTNDGVHPGPNGNALMAAALNTTLFV